ncbi:MAG TPA: IS1 family transposase [Firmicutes bacterium]|nr:IS1 family transposase [Bacillota bacterium]
MGFARGMPSGSGTRSHGHGSAGANHELRESAVVSCRRCGSRAVQRWGTVRLQSGVQQRYRCKDCGRTFNALTGTLRAYLKRRSEWDAFVRCMAERLTIRETAQRLGLHPTTVFRWRHRVLDALARQPQRMSWLGIVEMEDLYYPDCCKGQRYLDRPARRRWDWATRFSEEAVRVMVAVGGGVREAVGGAVGCRRRLEEWLGGFRGVAVRYLGGYLAWFRLTVLAEILPPEQLRAALMAEADIPGGGPSLRLPLAAWVAQPTWAR